jgi:hypothetical protein
VVDRELCPSGVAEERIEASDAGHESSISLAKACQRFLRRYSHSFSWAKVGAQV